MLVPSFELAHLKVDKRRRETEIELIRRNKMTLLEYAESWRIIILPLIYNAKKEHSRLLNS